MQENKRTSGACDRSVKPRLSACRGWATATAHDSRLGHDVHHVVPALRLLLESCRLRGVGPEVPVPQREFGQRILEPCVLLSSLPQRHRVVDVEQVVPKPSCARRETSRGSLPRMKGTCLHLHYPC